jgi:C4-type Zn-finger protein
MAQENQGRSDEYVTCPTCRINYLTGHIPRTVNVPGRGIGELTHYRCNTCGYKIPMSEAKHYGEFPPAGAVRGKLPS